MCVRGCVCLRTLVYVSVCVRVCVSCVSVILARETQQCHHTLTQRRQRSDLGRMRGVEEDACQRNRGQETEHQIRSHLRATNP